MSEYSASAATGKRERLSLRSDLVSGLITMAFGMLMVSFAICGLAMVVLQRMIIGFASPPPPAFFSKLMNAIHGIWIVHMPLMVIGGVVFAVAGWHLHRGSLIARRIAQTNAILGYVWAISYAVSCYQVLPLFRTAPVAILPPAIQQQLELPYAVFGALFGSIFPTLLLILLSRPRRASLK